MSALIQPAQSAGGIGSCKRWLSPSAYGLVISAVWGYHPAIGDARQPGAIAQQCAGEAAAQVPEPGV